MKGEENRMKKLLIIFLAIAMVVGITIPVVAATSGAPYETPLIAGQTEVVGKIQVWDDKYTLIA